MPEITTKNIRNVCLLGHGSSGKTSLAEAMLFCAGAIDRMGKVTDGNTVTDYDPEEVARHYSVSLSTANFTYHDIKVNLLDTPGYPDFVGEELEGIRAADAAVIMVDGTAGLQISPKCFLSINLTIRKRISPEYSNSCGKPLESAFARYWFP